MKNKLTKALSLALILILALSLSACGGKKEAAADVDLAAVMSEFQLGDEMMSLDLNELIDLYYFDEADIKQSAAAIHDSGVNCDEIIMIEATSADAAGRVKKILDERYQAKLNETENYLPDEYAIIQKCSVTQSGNFVAMIVSPDAAKLTEIYQKYVK